MEHSAKAVDTKMGYWWAVCTCGWTSDVDKLKAVAKDYAAVHMAKAALTNDQH